VVPLYKSTFFLIIISDLNEFFAIVDFLNPNTISPDAEAFNNIYTVPIAKSREPNATKEHVDLGTMRNKLVILII
jgi:SNF2 family DNA or RNA helicase